MTDILRTGPTAEADSAVAWPAVIAGAVAALAASVTLIALAAGFGFAAAPWPDGSTDHHDFTPIAGGVMLVIQVLACALGGYVAGRLRTRWTAIHEHEAHFRDSAHGLLVWATSTVVGVVLVAGVLAPPVAAAAGGAAAGAAPAAANLAADASAGAPPSLPTPTPEQKARLAADAERAKNIAAQFSLFMGVGLLLSGFTAAVAAVIGGLGREDMHRRYMTTTV